MNNNRRAQTQRKCYRQPNQTLRVIGVALIAAGLLLLFLCIPGWAWIALAGAALVAGGFLLITLAGGR